MKLLLPLTFVFRVPMTIINIFSKADAIAALIWASVLACVVSLMMLLIQRALTLQEYMNVIYI